MFLNSRTAVPQVHTPEVWPHPGASSSARVATFAAVQRVQKTWVVALCAVSLLSSRRMSTCLEKKVSSDKRKRIELLGLKGSPLELVLEAP